MHVAIIKALVDTNGPDLSGKIVPMPAGSYHLVSKLDLRYFQGHPDVFEVTSSDFDTAQPVTSRTDASGANVLATASGAALKAIPSGAGSNTIVFYGDSHQDKGQASSIAAAYKYEYITPNGAPFWLMGLTGQRFNIAGWLATGGKTSAEILGWIEDVLALNPGWVFYNAGTNDMAVAGITDPLVVIANIEATLHRLTSAGIKVIMITVPVYDPTIGGYTDAEHVCLKNINHLIRERVPNYPDVYLIDSYAIGVDPTSATGAPKTNYLLADKTHMSNLYAYEVGKAAAAIVNNMAPQVNRLITSAADNAATANQSSNYNLFTDPLILTTTGGTAGTGASGTVPSGWTVDRVTGAAGTGVAVSTAARADGFGNDLVQTLTGDAAETIGELRARKSISLTGLAAGDEFYALCEITVEASPTQIRNVAFLLTSTGTTDTYDAVDGQRGEAADWVRPLTEGYTRVFRTPNIVLPAGMASFQARVLVDVGPSAAGVVRCGRVSVHKVIA